MKCIKNKKLKGFTLVELIVVMIILAILAALIVPSMTGYIDKAKEKAIVTEARGIYTAAQTALSEYYAFHPDYASKSSFSKMSINGTINGKSYPGGKIYGRVSNNMLKTAQSGGTVQSAQGVDYAIASQVLEYIDSAKSDVTSGSATYSFNTGFNPRGKTMDWLKSNNKDKANVIICYDNKGKVVFVEFGRDDYIVHIENDNTFYPESFSNYPN